VTRTVTHASTFVVGLVAGAIAAWAVSEAIDQATALPPTSARRGHAGEGHPASSRHLQAVRP
jgi:hypothetical protein